jgi:hypothetical protein
MTKIRLPQPYARFLIRLATDLLVDNFTVSASDLSHSYRRSV